ncbi:uncharacterized protein EDB91DRAFT_1263675 [Suillus paluster]|uniref:uncharacterized protein n=1 Tax=Suillus paluster TaxID=48578 RepID=UPI001B864984|nr:uncharacterized protein EDB91DRAFT_1263675 [Suillus paluster]KAG1726520.1 hypothetical protein EDB91DRAFT_1263675 [Suillus paluster]
MQSMNQRSNALQSVLGIFLQLTHTPQKVVDTLSRIGILISTNSICAAIQSLSAELQNTLRTIGKSLLASYAYDNFDVDLKSQVPQAEKSNESLKHLTSGLLFPLEHGVTTDDLKCSEELWRRTMLNPHAQPSMLPPKRSWKDLLHIHLESRVDSTPQLSQHDRFNAHMFLLDLCKHRPLYFRCFRSEVPEAEAVEEIPLIKTPITAARAMDINNPTVSGNICAVMELLAQGGIYNPDANILDNPDISQYVILVHSDLGTGEWLHLMRDVTQLRPKEMGTYCLKPGFRRMHQLIGYAGICQWLDCCLKAFAASKPTLDELKIIANEIALKYQRDMQHENTLLLNKYFLLYEELSYSMNHGDIGRVETSIVAWIPILNATGKHKYATHMTNFLINTHFVFPTGLKHAVHYHILINPNGKAMKWRAVDWCVELNNLFMKVKNGGKGSNRTVERIFLESPLVQAYRNTQVMVQKNFLHAHLTTNHAAPNMTKTFEGLSIRMAVQSPHTVVLGRKTHCEIPDLIDKGRDMMEKAARDVREKGAEIEDILMELWYEHYYESKLHDCLE